MGRCVKKAREGKSIKNVRRKSRALKTQRHLIVFFVGAALSLVFGTSAYAIPMNAGATMTDGFRATWTAGHPNVTTVTNIKFKTTAVNFYLDPGAISGDFYWNGLGQQPDYTMDPNAGITQYSGHVGGSTSSLDIGNLTFDPNGNGKNFMTWYVDVPSLGAGQRDLIHFDLLSEQIISKTTVGSTMNLSIMLSGAVWDELNHWTSTLSAINLTVSETVAGSNYIYSWAATWATQDTPSVPEPSSVLLLGLGMTFLFAFVWLRKTRTNRGFLGV